MKQHARRIVLLTGMAGAGKTTAARAFEDLGFFCVDNLPVPLLDTFLTLLDLGAEPVQEVALVMDSRERDFARNWPKVFDSVARAGYRLEVVFLDASDPVLIRRYSETRRRHPLASGTKKTPLAQAIARERDLLAGLRAKSDLVVDTSELNVHQLKAIINRDFAGKSTSGEMAIAVLSFGFRYGTPREADLMLDVRFLPNPNFMPGLKEKTGLDRKVAAKVLDNKDGRTFLSKLESLLDFLIPRYRTEGKSYLTIGIGCTGGRHRSVAVAERIGADLTRRKLHVSVVHRDLERT